MRFMRRYHHVGLSVLVLVIAAFGAAQRLKGPLTIPLMDSMAANVDAVRSASPEPLAFPVMLAQPPTSAEAPAAPARSSAGDQLLGEVHVSAGDAASRPADPSPTDPLRIGFALGASSSVRVAFATDDGAEVATILENPSAPAGARVVEWNGTSAAGSPVPGGRYTLTVSAIEDTDVYRQSVHELHLFVERPRGGAD